MKWIHTSDLHIGKYLNEFSLLEDQRFFLEELQKLAEKEKVDAVLISGDLYDRSIPSADAVAVLDHFFNRMVLDLKIPVLAISGNHDSPQRLDFCSALLKKSGLYLAGSYQKNMECVKLDDAYGVVSFYLLPYLEPAQVRLDFPNLESRTYDAAFEAVMDYNAEKIDWSQRNVILAHGFFSYLKNSESVARCESEISLGGADLIDAKALERFDYAALGHIHRAQFTGKETICYSGSPLQYSISEIPFDKTVNLVTLKEKGQIHIENRKVPQMREFRIIKGFFNEILQTQPSDQQAQDLIFFSLYDTSVIPNAMNRLRSIYPNTVGMTITRQFNQENFSFRASETQKSMQELFLDFYKAITGTELEPKKQDILTEIERKLEYDDRNGESKL